MNWFLPIALFASLSVRTPSVLPNPYDYEISVGMQKAGFDLNHQWERELGKKLTQDFYSYEYKSEKWLVTDKYVFDGSTGLNYNKIAVTRLLQDLRVGYGLYHVDKIPSHRLVTGYLYDKRFNFILVEGKAVVKLDINTDFKHYGYSSRTDISFGLLRNLDFVFTLKTEKMDNKSLFQAKTSIGINMLGDKNG